MQQWTEANSLRNPFEHDINTVREARYVRNEAINKGEEAHFGSICELLYERHSEMPEHLRIAKGRAVFLGDNVKDQYYASAVFADLGSNPPTLEAVKTLDAYSLLPGMSQKQADAVSAYTQSFLGGTPCWVRLPKERWPKAWITAGYHDPVVHPVFKIPGN